MKFLRFFVFFLFSIYLQNDIQACFERNKYQGFWGNPTGTETNFFSKFTDISSQREDWYKFSPYIAEFWCTMSNIPFIYFGIKQKSPELIIAGTASIISHAIPKQWLNIVDKIGVIVAFSKIIREHKKIRKKPTLLIPVICAGLINVADTYLARNYKTTVPHVIWHISAACIANLFLDYIKN